MRLKLLGMGLSTGTLVLTGALLDVHSAQAAIIEGSNLGFGGSARLLKGAGNSYTLDFFLPKNEVDSPGNGAFTPTDASSGSFSTLLPSDPFEPTPKGVIQDLLLTKVSTNKWKIADGFSLAGAFISAPFSVPGFSFFLDEDSFELEQGSDRTFDFVFTGFFQDLSDGETIDGTGLFSAESDLLASTGSSLSGDVTAVPTPALLPGLVGLGVAALRRKQGKSAGENA